GVAAQEALAAERAGADEDLVPPVGGGGVGLEPGCPVVAAPAAEGVVEIGDALRGRSRQERGVVRRDGGVDDAGDGGVGVGADARHGQGCQGGGGSTNVHMQNLLLIRTRETTRNRW